MIATALAVSYCALVSFYHSDTRRAGQTVVANIGSARLHLLKWIGWGLLAGALVLCLVSAGAARGVSIWFGLIGVCAALSLVIATLRPEWHLISIAWVVGLVLLFSGWRYLF